MPIVALEPPRDFESPLHSQGIVVPSPGRLAFVSGQVGVRADATMGSDLSPSRTSPACWPRRTSASAMSRRCGSI